MSPLVNHFEAICPISSPIGSEALRVHLLLSTDLCSQFYKLSTTVKYDFRVVLTSNIPFNNDFGVIIYDCRGFIGLATGHTAKWPMISHFCNEIGLLLLIWSHCKLGNFKGISHLSLSSLLFILFLELFGLIGRRWAKTRTKFSNETESSNSSETSSVSSMSSSFLEKRRYRKPLVK